MTDEERKRYLANIYHLVQADGDVAQVEDKLYDKIANAIGAAYLERRDAKEMASARPFVIEYPERYSDRVRLIEDLLLFAMADETLHPMEKRILSVHAQKVGITQQQFEVIRRETQQRLAEILESIH